MAVSLKKSAKVDLSKSELPQKMREYTPVHLMDEEESTPKSDGKTDPPTDENDDFTEAPKSIPKRIAKKILGKLDDIWFEIKYFDTEGFCSLIVLTVTFVMILLLIPFLSNMMGEIAFDLSAVETSAEIVSIGTAEKNDRQGVVVMFTDIYGNEQRSNILIDKSANIKIGDIISIRYDPDNAEKVSVEKPIIGILDV